MEKDKINEFYKKITEWVLPKGFQEIYKNHPCASFREFHFIKNATRICFVIDEFYDEYCYASASVLKSKYPMCLKSGRFRVLDEKVFDVHKYIKQVVEKIEFGDVVTS